MMSREEIKRYALQICVPLMERTLRRVAKGYHAFKADQVGFIPSELENFCRPFWGIAPLLAQGEEIRLNAGSQSISVYEYMRGFLRRGFSHGREESWDNYREFFAPYVYENQNITELAGLAVGLFFARKQLWDPLPSEEKEQIAAELLKMAETAYDHSWPNNHYWFPLFVVTVLKRLSFRFERTEEMLENGLDFLDRLYLGEGWYKDGEFGRFDYYEAWSLHLYPLLWTMIADTSFKGYEERKKKYVERTNQFLKCYIHWFDKEGAHVPFGRSLSYRFAACALFPAAVLAGCDIAPALAGRITAMNIGFFRDHCRLEETDILPEGYLYHTGNVIEGYTSDGGAYWCCKAFLALLIEEGHPFWDYDQARLPIEEGNYLIAPENKEIHMLFEGQDGIVTLYNNTAQYYFHNQMTHKFGDVRGWYSKFVYSSAGGFGCSGSDNVSIDNMISLMTPDRSMVSHRLGFLDLGKENGALHSVHIPFSNDPQSFIESWILPLNGMHVRVHRVRLSQNYYVSEGGFSLGRWDDYCPKETGKDFAAVSNREYGSALKAVCDRGISLCCRIESPQAGFHLYAPLSEYPVYTTETALEAGEYLFAAAFCLYRKKAGFPVFPDISIVKKKVEITVNHKKVFERSMDERDG